MLYMEEHNKQGYGTINKGFYKCDWMNTYSHINIRSDKKMKPVKNKQR